MLRGIIRDDDVSFFTTPELLEAIYARVWERNIPVCFSVIPAHKANILIPRRVGDPDPYDPNVPPHYRGQDRDFPITENKELVIYLREKAKRGHIEIVHHGYNHDWYEFGTDDESVLRQKLDDGAAILKEAFPDIPIRSFVAPYDRITPKAIQMVLDMGYDWCGSSHELHAIPGMEQIRGYEGWQLPSGRKLFTVDEYLWHWEIDAETCYQLAMNRLDEENLILCNHYWAFNPTQKQPNQALVDRWNKFLDVLLTQDRKWTNYADGETKPLQVTV
ncbi:MAG: DUF2334 domain-containing protein [Anaerolineae bacterium]|nr:DUF2334 domain-containing protein [Anaerolineae bacterium]